MKSIPVLIRIASASCLIAGVVQGQVSLPSCNRTIDANVIALDQALMMNRLGSAIPGGMIYALARDVSPQDPVTGLPKPITCDAPGSACTAGQVTLRAGKRPRPIVLRVSVGDCLAVSLTNLVTPVPTFNQLTQIPFSATPKPGEMGQLWGQSDTRAVGFHVAGLDFLPPADTGLPASPPPTGCTPLRSDGDFVGRNCSSQANPGQTRAYKFFAREEGHFLLYSKDDALAYNGNDGQIQEGLFGSVSVEPEKAEYFRSQVLQTDLQDATYVACSSARTTDCVGSAPGQCVGSARSLVPKPGTGGKQFTLTMSETRQCNIPSPNTWTVTVVKDTQQRLATLDGQPLINYYAAYAQGNAAGQPVGTPILSMLRPTNQAGEFELVHSDLTAIITGPDARRFPDAQQSPLFSQNPALPDRREPFREFTVQYHASSSVVQAFQGVPPTVTDSFGVNYGMGGIGNEIMANRLKEGAPADCVECKFEEFFLSSWVLGDPAMLVDHPTGGGTGSEKEVMNGSHAPDSASAQQTIVSAEQKRSAQEQQQIISAQIAALPVEDGQIMLAAARARNPKPTKVFFPDDPSNVYHSYMRDHVKFRIGNVSPIQSHVHHQHAHQWLQTPNSDDSTYLDSQLVVPGSTYTLEMTYNGSGNRNQTVGDSIFHCHFYPHFAGGMWALWRVHDVLEVGTALTPDGSVAKTPFNRALPDAEIESGTPIPAIVPLPTLGMAPVPAKVSLADHGTRVVVSTDAGGGMKNPGFPFFVPGLAGHRAPHPPLDFAAQETTDSRGVTTKEALDGGLPRHMILSGKVVNEFHTRWDFTKDTDGVFAYRLPEDGTSVEKAAMADHSRRTRSTFQPDGMSGTFIENGLPPASGAPFARPDIDDNGNQTGVTRRYKAAVFQTDAVLNKEGWHYPQQRWLSLWNDVPASLDGSRAPQPLFFRANSGENLEFWHTNLVPSYYEMDDYEVRTPTDIIGQHIHLVKFDVLASDGAANGFNYEDGTFAFDEVTDRIKQVNKGFGGPGGLYSSNAATSISSCLNSASPLRPCLSKLTPQRLTAKPATAIFPANKDLAGKYAGAQTTIQLWRGDPLLNNQGRDRTLRTVFTHDHYGPSTHQNVGLYAGLLIEPPGSSWFDPVNGTQLGMDPKRADGGPTDWQANVVTPNPADSYREFALEFQDLQSAYTAVSKSAPSVPAVPLFTVAESTKGFAQDILLLTAQKKLPADLAVAFRSNGITLSANPQVIPAAQCPTPTKYTWCIQDPTAYPGQTFGISSIAQGGAGSFEIFTPTMHPGWADPANAISTNSTPTNPNPGVINSSPSTGTYSVNYRNEPLALRLNQNGGSAGRQTDPAWAFASLDRNDLKLNSQPAGSPISPGSPFKYPLALSPSNQLQSTDPYTPLLSAYENDRVQIRTLVGAHTMTHSFRMNGLNWLYEPSYQNSGYKSAQGMGISEHFEMEFRVPAPVKTPSAKFSDYLYATSSSMAGLIQGNWGLMRAWDGGKGLLPNLQPLPNNPQGRAAKANITSGCPANTPTRKYTVVAASPQQIGLANGLVYNSRNAAQSTATQAAVYVNADDLENGKLKAGITRIEPLILRASAGECVQITLNNFLAAPPAQRTLPAPFVAGQVPVTITPSQQAGLQADLLSFNVNLGAGLNVGFNNIGPGALNGTVAPGGVKILEWYTGKIAPDGTGVPTEFGAVPLTPADPLNQAADGMVGTLVVEPAGSIWTTDPGTRASATVTRAGAKPFREFVVILQNALVPFGAGVQSGINYRSEPLSLRPQNPAAPNPNFIIFETNPATITQYLSTLSACAKLAPAACPQLATSSLATALKTPEKFAGNTNPPKGGYPVIPTATVNNVSIPGATAWAINNGQIVNGKFQGYVITIQLGAGNQQLLVRVPFTSLNSALSNFSNFLSNTRVGGVDPQTPIFCAAAGDPVRFRVTQPGGDFDHMIVVDGHSWKQEPYASNSRVQANNVLAQQMGTQVVSVNEKLDLLIDSAGGPARVTGDYLYHSFQFEPYGMWGLFRVVPENTPADKVKACAAN